MRKQQKIWQEEHQRTATLPRMDSEDPSSAVVWFTDYLQQKKTHLLNKIIDIGCGKGRNAVYLAQQGFEVWAVDYIPEALAEVQRKAKDLYLEKDIHTQEMAIDQAWPFSDNFFGVAIDCFSSIDVETKKGREAYQKEMLRTLKPGGYAFVAVVSADDELESEMIRQKPGPEPNSTYWEGTNKFQKDYDEAELREFYKDFEVVEVKKVTKPAFKLGKKYMATNFWVVLRKK